MDADQQAVNNNDPTGYSEIEIKHQQKTPIRQGKHPHALKISLTV